MVATLGLFVYSGTNAATESASAVTGISFFGSTTTTASNTALADRQADPVVVGSNSASKSLRLKITASPANGVTNFKFWTDGSGQANVGLVGKVVGTGGATPGTGGETPTTSAITSSTNAYTWTSGSPLIWDSASYVTTGHVTKSLVLQLQPTGSATPGNWTQETLSYSYDET